MNRLLLCAVSVVFLSTAAAAQTGICSGGTTDPFFAPQFGSGGVWIYFETKQYLAYSGPNTTTEVSVSGNNIAVVQLLSDAPPPPPPPGSTPPTCLGSTVFVGALAPGTYNVIWTYGAVLMPGPGTTYRFTIVVPNNVPVPLFDPRLVGVLTLVLAAIGVWILRR